MCVCIMCVYIYIYVCVCIIYVLYMCVCACVLYIYSNPKKGIKKMKQIGTVCSGGYHGNFHMSNCSIFLGLLCTNMFQKVFE